MTLNVPRLVVLRGAQRHLAKRHCLAHRICPSRHHLQPFYHCLINHNSPTLYTFSLLRFNTASLPIASRISTQATVSYFSALAAPSASHRPRDTLVPQQVSSPAPRLGEYSRANNRAKPQHQQHTPPLHPSFAVPAASQTHSVSGCATNAHQIHARMIARPRLQTKRAAARDSRSA